MPGIAYTVVATLPDPAVAGEYIAWLRGGHVEAVVRAGATSGVIVRIEDPPSPIQVETRYLFPDQPALERYLRDAAPSLRAEGLARFGPERGVSFRRTIGSVQ